MGNERAEKKWTLHFFQEQVRLFIRPSRLFLSLISGLILGIIAVTVSTAFAALIFSGELSPYLPAGIGLMLVGSMMVGFFLALFSSIPNIVGGLQDTSIAILSITTIAILKDIPASTSLEQKFYTTLAAITLSTLVTGILFLLLGYFRLGKLIYSIPYPVMGGFLAGSGLLLVFGGLGLLINLPVRFWNLSLLLKPGYFHNWIPGTMLAILMTVLLRRYKHPLLMVAALFSAAGLFYAALLLSGISIHQAADQGWLLDSMLSHSYRLWIPLKISLLNQVNWAVLLRHGGNLIEIAIVNLITLLLNASGIEMVTKRNLDLNRELYAAGLANIAAALCGAFGGTHTISDSILSHKIGARSRLVGLTLALFCGVVLFTGFAFLAFFPRFVLGGLLIFLGLDFLVTWVYEARFELARIDYLTVILIMIIMNTAGLLTGMGIGLLMTRLSVFWKRKQVAVTGIPTNK